MSSISNFLFFKDKELYEKINQLATKFYKSYNFNGNPSALKEIIKNYANENNVVVKILYLPLKDIQLWGLFYQLNGIYFIVVNSEISINKQIVTLAHEFYHLYSLVEEITCEKENFLLDILSSKLEEIDIEDKKANAFAACFLMPDKILKNIFRRKKTFKSEIIQFREKIIKIKLIMDYFMVPYKTAVIRLMEIDYLTQEEGLELIDITNRDLRDKFENPNLVQSSRWDIIDKNLFDLDDLDHLISTNEELELMSLKKIKKDREIVENIKKQLKDNNLK